MKTKAHISCDISMSHDRGRVSQSLGVFGLGAIIFQVLTLFSQTDTSMFSLCPGKRSWGPPQRPKLRLRKLENQGRQTETQRAAGQLCRERLSREGIAPPEYELKAEGGGRSDPHAPESGSPGRSIQVLAKRG